MTDQDPKPSVGRIVHYVPRGYGSGQEWPHAAMIVGVYCDSVDLAVFSLPDKHMQTVPVTIFAQVHFAKEYTPGYATWPPRV